MFKGYCGRVPIASRSAESLRNLIAHGRMDEDRNQRRLGGAPGRYLRRSSYIPCTYEGNSGLGLKALPSAKFNAPSGLNPRLASAHYWYATSCLVPAGRLGEALEEMRIAQSLDPVSSIIARDLAMMLFSAAISKARSSSAITPSN